TITRTNGCFDVMEKKIKILGPTGIFKYTPLNGCSPVKIDFTATTLNTRSILWDFNDGVTLNTIDSTVSHSYTHSGIYLPKMILSDLNGCHVPILGKDTIRVNEINARFNFLNHALC